ncbi:hypothetical protein C2S52_021116 [Perilla frutescens var. hirtella]|nr:hypothetical protein C2S52_021116 [Perilla frutescens var. hirtella]
MYWPMFVVAVRASIIASQAMISATFYIIQQSLSLGCFPRVKIVHTSTKYQGQVYIPEINYVLMFACVCVTLGFRTTIKIRNAYGIVLVFVMAVTSAFLVLVTIMIWKTNIVLVIFLIKGVFTPRVHYVHDDDHVRVELRLQKEVLLRTRPQDFSRNCEGNHSRDEFSEGLAIIYSELVHGIPPIFKHYVANVPALHSVLVFISFKSLSISSVPKEKRFLFRRLLIERLKEFVREDGLILAEKWQGKENVENENENEDEILKRDERGVEEEIGDLDQAWRSGVVHLVGEHEVMAAKGANLGKTVVIDYAYNFMKKSVRQSNTVFDILGA